MHVVAAKAVALKEAMSDEFKAYQGQILKNAVALADRLMERGFSLVSGGTDNHLMLVDVRNRNLSGKQAEKILDEVGITVNKNAIPFDPVSPMITSGIRLGTPATTTRGMKEEAMREIADLIDMALSHPEDAAVHAQVKDGVKALCEKHPLY